MSTKTTFKRIALVAVAALGFGVLTAVAPATAANTKATSLTVGTVAPSRVGVATTIPVTVTVTPSGATATDTTTVSIKITSAPAGSAFATQQYTGTAGFVAGVQATGTPNKAKLSVASAAALTVTGAATAQVYTASTDSATDSNTVYAIVTETATAATAHSYTLYLTVTPDVAGSYTALISSGTGTSFAAGDTTTTATFTTAGAPTSVTLTRLNSSTTDSSVAGSLVTVGLKDAAGNPTVLAANEALDFAVTGTGISVGAVAQNATTGVNANQTALSASDFWNAGTAVLRVYAGSAISADTSAVLTLSGSGLLPATLTSNTTISVLKSTAAASGHVISMTDATGYEANTAPSYYTNGSSHGYTYTVGTAVSATTVYGVNIKDQDNQIVKAATADLEWNIPVIA